MCLIVLARLKDAMRCAWLRRNIVSTIFKAISITGLSLRARSMRHLSPIPPSTACMCSLSTSPIKHRRCVCVSMSVRPVAPRMIMVTDILMWMSCPIPESSAPVVMISIAKGMTYGYLWNLPYPIPMQVMNGFSMDIRWKETR